MLVSDLDLPGLSRLMRRAASVASPLAASAPNTLLFQLLDVTRPDGGDWPCGALSRLAAEPDAGEGIWMHADPVHLRPDMGKLILFAPATLALTLDEADAITGWLNAHEHAPGPTLEPTHAASWHVQLDAVPGMQTVSPEEVHGEDVMHRLPAGPDAGAWHRCMNEIQMLLHQCPVNEAREREGRPGVNSVWFWGAGRLPASPTCRFDSLWGDGHLVAGLGRWCGTPAQPLPRSGTDFAATPPTRDALLVLDTLFAPALCSDIGAWRDALLELDRDWLVPLADALRRGRLSRLDVHAGAGCGVSITSRDMRRWWRRDMAPGDALATLRRPLLGERP